MSTIATRLASVRARVEVACAAAGRPQGSVRLLAASKTRSIAEVAEAAAAGQRLFGENRAQELRDKADALPEVEWHYIGPLQRNKVKYVVGRVAMMHSVDGEDIARALAERVRNVGAPPLPVLVEINIAAEPSKAGVAPANCLALCETVAGLPGLELAGLMAVPPFTEDPRSSATWHRAVADLATEGRARGLPLRELSLGMSHDLEVAVACGATIVRVGTDIFGER